VGDEVPRFVERINWPQRFQSARRPDRL